MSTTNSEPKRRFFNIPHVKIGQGQKRQRWIAAIKQINGEEWEPKISNHLNNEDKVCSSHFRSGNHSINQWDEDYVPHIFNNDFEKYSNMGQTSKMEKTKQNIGAHCCIKTCLSTNLTKPKPRFFNIPSVKEGRGLKRQRWISAIRQVNGNSWEPRSAHTTNGEKVCSRHFKSGEHSRTQWDEDYAPHIFSNDFEKYVTDSAR